MRDVKDPGTIDMPLARKPGPRPKNGKAMSAAERMRIYRAGRREAASKRSVARYPSGKSDAVILDALRIAVSEGRASAIWLLTAELRDRYPSNS